MLKLTQEQLKKFAKTGRQEEKGMEAEVIVKFFTPDAQATWYATEFEPETGMFFGFVNLGCTEDAELGYFSLAELQQVRGRLGLPVEIDRYFGKKTLTEIMSRG